MLKYNRAKTVRLSTLTAICDVLDCQVGDLFEAVEAVEAVEAIESRDGAGQPAGSGSPR